MIDRITRSYLNKVHSNIDQFNPESDTTHLYKLPYKLEKIQSKFRKSCQKSVNSSAEMVILKLFLLLLSLITISQVKVKHPVF